MRRCFDAVGWETNTELHFEARKHLPFNNSLSWKPYICYYINNKFSNYRHFRGALPPGSPYSTRVVWPVAFNSTRKTQAPSPFRLDQGSGKIARVHLATIFINIYNIFVKPIQLDIKRGALPFLTQREMKSKFINQFAFKTIISVK